LGYADAVSLGRRGRPAQAAETTAAVTTQVASMRDVETLAPSALRQAALRDGWGRSDDVAPADPTFRSTGVRVNDGEHFTLTGDHVTVDLDIAGIEST
jgi:hypothetical protein